MNFKKGKSLSIVLGFVMTGTWFFWELEEDMTEQEMEEKERLHLSLIRYWFEKLEQEILSAAEGRFMQKLLRFCG